MAFVIVDILEPVQIDVRYAESASGSFAIQLSDILDEPIAIRKLRHGIGVAQRLEPLLSPIAFQLDRKEIRKARKERLAMVEVDRSRIVDADRPDQLVADEQRCVHDARDPSSRKHFVLGRCRFAQLLYILHDHGSPP